MGLFATILRLDAHIFDTTFGDNGSVQSVYACGLSAKFGDWGLDCMLKSFSESYVTVTSDTALSKTIEW